MATTTHVLSVLVENKPGVLSRVTGMISRRGFNIESLAVGPTEDSTRSRVTIVVAADEVSYEQITKQLHKLVSVHKITDLTNDSAIERELVLFKVNAAGRAPLRDHRDSQRVSREHRRCGQKLAHRGSDRRRSASFKGMEDLLPRLRHQGNHAHRQNRHVAQFQRRLRPVLARPIIGG